MTKTLIFLPCYNVETKIENVIKKISKNIILNKKIKFLFINDKSSDQTKNKVKQVIKKYKLKAIILNNKKNLGYGGVQKIAYDFAIKKNFTFVLMLHGDNQYPSNKINNLLKKFSIDKYDAVFGTRMHSIFSAFKGGMPIYKIIGNKFLTGLQNIILNSSMSEFHSGFRSYRVNSLKKINYKKFSNQFHFDTEIIINLLFKGFKIKEVPMPTFYGNEISHLKSIPYGINIIKVSLKHRLKKN
jgi:glycosyltransferase involved in cell wall biosynthesis